MIITENKALDKKKEGGLVIRLLRFLVDNAFQFTVSIVGFVHVVLLAIFGIADIAPMMLLNSISIAIYVVCFVLSNADHIVFVYSAVIVEVTAYSIISTYFVGLRCGTYCFLFSIV